MRDLNLNAKYDVIIGHGTSADALIRYLESERLPKAVFIDCADIYTAGERHGRAYLYPRIRDNCKHIRIVALTKKGAYDALTLRKELDRGVIYNLDPIIEDYDTINEIIQYKIDKGYILHDTKKIRPAPETDTYSQLILSSEERIKYNDELEEKEQEAEFKEYMKTKKTNNNTNTEDEYNLHFPDPDGLDWFPPTK
jgi:hypothetical protein